MSVWLKLPLALVATVGGQVLGVGYAIMIGVGMVHHWWPTVPTMAYTTALPLAVAWLIAASIRSAVMNAEGGS